MADSGSGRSAGRGGLRTQRQLRVGELVRRVLIEILDRGGVRDPDLAGVSLTVSEVEVSPDLRAATVWVMPLGGVGQNDVIAGLSRAAPFLRTQVARRLTLRHVPRLMFRIDTAFDAAGQINDLLRRTGHAPDDRGESDHGT